METTQPKREEILKILQMIEDGKIDQDKALGMMAMLEGKNLVGGPHGVVTDATPKWMKISKSLAAFGLLVALLYVLFVYLPIHASFEVIAIVYGFLGLTVIGGVIVGVVAIVKTMSVGRAAVEKRP